MGLRSSHDPGTGRRLGLEVGIRSSGKVRVRGKESRNARTADDAEYARRLDALGVQLDVNKPETHYQVSEIFRLEALAALLAYTGPNRFLKNLKWKATHIADWTPTPNQAVSIQRILSFSASDASRRLQNPNITRFRIADK